MEDPRPYLRRFLVSIGWSRRGDGRWIAPNAETVEDEEALNYAQQRTSQMETELTEAGWKINYIVTGDAYLYLPGDTTVLYTLNDAYKKQFPPAPLSNVAGGSGAVAEQVEAMMRATAAADGGDAPTNAAATAGIGPTAVTRAPSLGRAGGIGGPFTLTGSFPASLSHDEFDAGSGEGAPPVSPPEVVSPRPAPEGPPTGFYILLNNANHPAFEDLLEFAIVAPIVDGKGHDDLYKSIDAETVLKLVWKGAEEGAYKGTIPATHAKVKELLGTTAFRTKVLDKIRSVKSDAAAKTLIASMGRNICTKIGVDFDFQRGIDAPGSAPDAQPTFGDYKLYTPGGGGIGDLVDGVRAILGTGSPLLLHVDSITGSTYVPLLTDLKEKGVSLYNADSPGVRGDPASYNPITYTAKHRDVFPGGYATTRNPLRAYFPACLPIFQCVEMVNKSDSTQVVKKMWLWNGNPDSDGENSGLIQATFEGESVDIEICRALTEAIAKKGLVGSVRPVSVTGNSGIVYKFSYDTSVGTKLRIKFDGYYNPKKGRSDRDLEGAGSLLLEWNVRDSVLAAATTLLGGIHAVAAAVPLLKSDGDAGSARCTDVTLFQTNATPPTQTMTYTTVSGVASAVIPNPSHAHVTFDRISRDIAATLAHSFEFFLYPNGTVVAGKPGSRGGVALTRESVRGVLSGKGWPFSKEVTVTGGAEPRAYRDLLAILSRVAGALDGARYVRKTSGFVEMIAYLKQESARGTEENNGTPTTRFAYVDSLFAKDLAKLETGTPLVTNVDAGGASFANRARTIVQYAQALFSYLASDTPGNESTFLQAVSPLILELRALRDTVENELLINPALREQARRALTASGTAVYASIETDLVRPKIEEMATIRGSGVFANADLVDNLRQVFKDLAVSEIMDSVAYSLFYETLYTNPESLLAEGAEAGTLAIVNDTYQTEGTLRRALVPGDRYLDARALFDTLNGISDANLGGTGGLSGLLSNLRKLFIQRFGFDARTATRATHYAYILAYPPQRREITAAGEIQIDDTKTQIVSQEESLDDNELMKLDDLKSRSAYMLVHDFGSNQDDYLKYIRNVLRETLRDREVEEDGNAVIADEPPLVDEEEVDEKEGDARNHPTFDPTSVLDLTVLNNLYKSTTPPSSPRGVGVGSAGRASRGDAEGASLLFTPAAALPRPSSTSSDEESAVAADRGREREGASDPLTKIEDFLNQLSTTFLVGAEGSPARKRGRTSESELADRITPSVRQKITDSINELERMERAASSADGGGGAEIARIQRLLERLRTLNNPSGGRRRGTYRKRRTPHRRHTYKRRHI